jgi:hypothetical protein
VNKSALDSLQSIRLRASVFGTTTGKVESLAIAGGEFIGTPIRQLICRMPYADYGELFLRTRVNKGERKAWGPGTGSSIDHRCWDPGRTSRYFGRERQAPMRDRKASDENMVRTPFQKFHGPSYSALTCARAVGGAHLAHAGEFLVHRHVHQERHHEATPDVEYAGQRHQHEAARTVRRGV